ncbi:M15 family metallopeptidase [Pontibacter sp. CAU 1760]
MKVLKIGDKGADVKRWQFFLTGQLLNPGAVDGLFGDMTKKATEAFQGLYGLQPDGIVGNRTMGMAMTLGFGLLDDDRQGILGEHWPPKPNFRPLISHRDRASIFGHFRYKSQPRPDNPEHIEVLDNWAHQHIVRVEVPQLARVMGGVGVYFHRMAAAQLQQLWREWEQHHLLRLVLTWHGAYAPRFIRGSRTQLSNHAFGTAFDINYAWNMLGTQPALVGQKGSVRELVAIANQNGFYWGGHFTRSDGMHFELAWVR